MLDQDEHIIHINVEDEMKQAYIDYSMSVIVSRALPDVRDGFKPVHRRVLYGMNELGNTSDKPYKKSARIVGDVMGKYHPHGDSSIYMTLVRMAQDWSLRYPLVDPQGNFGSIDGDGPAAMRYTEARLQKIAEEMLKDIDKETVNFDPNFDETTKEPQVLPTKLPNLLVNGSQGIAVGMATNMAPHNLSEVCDAIVAYVANPEITIDELMHYIKAPDFPTGGFIYGYAGVKEAFETGRGRIVIRSKAEIESNEKTHDKIVITEIPYMVNRAELIRSIADLAIDKKVDGIANVNDESDRHGMRIVVDVKKDANASVLLNKLYKMTALQSSFSVNNVALVKGKPRQLNLKELIQYFVEHRLDVVTRRTEFDLKKARERAELLEGCIKILDALDEAIAIIRSSVTPDEAKQRLMDCFELNERQAQYIVELRLRQLTGMEQDKLRAEYEDLMKLIADLEDILAHVERRMEIITNETIELKNKYGDERRTQIIFASDEFNPEDFYSDDEMVITLSHMGYIKRTPLAEFKAQNRGGCGSKGSSSRDEDFIEYIYTASMHATIMFFTQRGRCYWQKVYDIPEGNKSSKGRAIQNLLNIESGDAITAFIKVKQLEDPEFTQSHNLVFCTKQGVIKKTSLYDYSRPRQNGINAITIRKDDRVVEVHLTSGKDEILIANRNGRAIRFNEETVRVMGRTATGVRAMRLDDGDDEVIGMITMPIDSEDNVLVVSELGYGKRSDIDTYRITNRGGKGVKTINITEKTGRLVAIKCVNNDNDLMIINKSGVVIRFQVSDLSVIGRTSQGVRLINLGKRNDQIASVCVVPAYEEPNEETVEGEDTENNK
ncbi:MAG: DNA gyrase subunit A [Paludibacteraceae bacterium]|nr:DNA gyrase subunit A [Paludibacteraceae bacterium]